MGVGQSVNASPVFASIQNWPWTRVLAVVKAYNDEELDFGIDHSVVSHLTGLTTAESKSLIAQLSKSDSGIVNAITMLITIAALGESGHLMLDSRLETIFELMDFDGTAQITMDEMTILLLCVASSFSSVLSKPEQCPSDMTMSKLTLAIYNDLNKKPSRPMLKSEFLSWATQCLANVSPINMETVFDAIFVKAASMKVTLKQSETKEIPDTLNKSDSQVDAKRSPRPAVEKVETKASPRAEVKEEKPLSSREIKQSPRPEAKEKIPEKVASARSEAKVSPRPEEKMSSARSDEKPVTSARETKASPEPDNEVQEAELAEVSAEDKAEDKVEEPEPLKDMQPEPEVHADAEVKEPSVDDAPAEAEDVPVTETPVDEKAENKEEVHNEQDKPAEEPAAEEKDEEPVATD